MHLKSLALNCDRKELGGTGYLKWQSLRSMSCDKTVFSCSDFKSNSNERQVSGLWKDIQKFLKGSSFS